MSEDEKLEYKFGDIKEITLIEDDEVLEAYAYADAMPGGDGRDPSRLPVAT